MSIFRGLTQRINGSYRYKQRILAAGALQEINSKSFTNLPGLERYFEFYRPYLQKISRSSRLCFYVGSFLANKFLGYSKEDLSPRHQIGADKMLQIFGREKELLDFGGVKTAYPNSSDEHFFHLLFREIIIPFFFWKTAPAVCAYFGETWYEYNNVTLAEGEVVIDVGANVGFFSACAASKGCKIYAFEPSSYNRKYLDATAIHNTGIEVIPFALSDHECEIEFFNFPENLGCTVDIKLMTPKKVEMNGHLEKVQAVRLDDFVKQKEISRVDFIKADIEGAERDFLKGAIKTIQRFKPKLAICTYHLPDDPVVLPQIILSANPEYQIFQGEGKLYAEVG